MLSILQLYATAMASTDAAASIDIPEDGEIVGVDWSMTIAGASFADADSMTAQLSFLSTSQFITNDARGTISVCTIGVSNITTSGMASVTGNKFAAFKDALMVAGGERLYLHLLEFGATNVHVWALVHLFTKAKTTRRSARRR